MEVPSVSCLHCGEQLIRQCPGLTSCPNCYSVPQITDYLDDDELPSSSSLSVPAIRFPFRMPPPPNSLMPWPLHVHSHGRKRAVLCAVSYRNTRRELKGCVNDANCMKHLLIKRFDFPESCILMLTEDNTDPRKTPTKRNIRISLHWLIQACQPGDSLVFLFSGHGFQQKCFTGDEVDGYDEALCPLDFETKGMILDDEINATLIRPLLPGVKLHTIIDACHSGTVVDLPFLCRMKKDGRYSWEEHLPRTGVWKGTSGGKVVSFSGCDDGQISADTSVLSKVATTGAMTFCFIKGIESGHGCTYGSLLKFMQSAIRGMPSVSGSGGIVSSIATSLLSLGGLTGFATQEPQLTSNEPFDVHTQSFCL